MSTLIFPKERQDEKQIFPYPEDKNIITENPPVLSWLPLEGNPTYTVTIWDEKGNEIVKGCTNENYFVPSIFLPEEKCSFDVEALGVRRGVVQFEIAKGADKIKRISAEELYERVPVDHPRHLFFSSDIPELLKTHTVELQVLNRNVEQAYLDGIPKRPMFHWGEQELPYREYFGQFRDYCDRDLIACGLQYALLKDEKAGAHGKELLLTFCDWNPEGPCSLRGEWGDEVGLSMARCLPAAYDLLYPLLDDKQRRYVASTIHAYGKQCRDRLKKLNYCLNPGDSHAGRIPAYMGEAAMVIKDSGVQEKEEALEWISYALEIYGGIFPYYGTLDGGWAEGPFYASSYTKWYLPFFSAVERYGGTQFLKRPFYRNLTRFFLHFANPDYENHPFGDGYWCHPTDKEWPGFFAQSPCRYYAKRFGPREAIQQAEEAANPDLYLLHLLDVFLPLPKEEVRVSQEKLGNVACFQEAGFFALHTDIQNAGNDICLLGRASKFGSDSHRHPDQGSFALFINGVSLISPSGYFGRKYGSIHHQQWLNSTRAHNAILVDGEGQPRNSRKSIGKILSVSEEAGERVAVVEMGASYEKLNRWERKFVLTDGKLEIIDTIEAKEEVTISYPLHMLSLPKEEDGKIVEERKGHRLEICPDESLHLVEITDRFKVDLNEGEPKEYHVSMPTQYHVLLETVKKKNHYFKVTYIIR